MENLVTRKTRNMPKKPKHQQVTQRPKGKPMSSMWSTVNSYLFVRGPKKVEEKK